MARDERTRPTRTGSGSEQTWLGQGALSRGHASFSRNSTQCAFAAALLSLLFVTQQIGLPNSVDVVVDGTAHRTFTTQPTVGAFLQQIGIDVADGMQIAPPPETPLTSDMHIVVRRLRPVRLILPDREVVYHGLAQTPAAMLQEVGLALGTRDLVTSDGIELSGDGDLVVLRSADVARDTVLVASSPLRIEGVRVISNPRRFGPLEPVNVTVDRALPVMVHEHGQTVAMNVRGSTLREALAGAGVPILAVDLVRPDPASTPQAGMHVYLERAKDVVLKADGATRLFRSRAERVGDLLEEQGITLDALDQVTPSVAAPVKNNVEVKVVRVREERLVEEDIVAFARQRNPASDLLVGEKRVVQAGSPGILRRFFLVRYEDGEEVRRDLTGTLQAADTRTEIIEFGTRASSVQTPDGPKEYTRTMRVWATWYNASHGDKPRTSPAYGLTSLGLRATQGVMAVDPRVIPYWTKAYVPGYGIAVAGDTGGGIKGNMIDLAFDEGATVTWGSRYVDIYLLGTPTLQDALRAAFPDE